jgi:hydroxypyruvate reductase
MSSPLSTAIALVPRPEGRYYCGEAMTGTRGTLASECEAIWREALGRLQAARLVSEALAAEPLPPGPVRVLAIGKAAGPMTQAALAALGVRARDPLCVLPAGAAAPRGARAIAAGHPRPTEGSREAGAAILAWASEGGGAPALVLLSGGGSALAFAPAEGLAAEDKIEAVASLMRAGATIQRLNTLRKHLSALKGGRLGARLAPALVRVLVLSDVPGDDLSSIASGPLAPDPTTFADALRALDEARAEVPAAARAHLLAGARGEREETPKPGDPRLALVSHRLLAGPVHLARAAADAAGARGFAVEVDPEPLVGDVVSVAARLGAWARANAGKGRRLLALGGEPTVRVPQGARNPDGGRAQHLALLAAREVAGVPAAVLAAGSDGRDGPTEQAGAVVDGETMSAAAAAGVDVDAALAEGRSGPACVALGAAIPRIETGTHLCDLVTVAVR